MKLMILAATGGIGRQLLKQAGTIDYTDTGGDGPVMCCCTGCYWTSPCGKG